MIVCASGCAKTVYLKGDEEMFILEKGEPAPFAGWLVNPNKMAEIFDRLGEEDPE